MKKANSGSPWQRGIPQRLWGAIGWISIGVAMVGALALCSCATSEKGLTREQALYAATTNAVAVVGAVASNLPPPYGTVFKGVVVGCGILMAVWLTNLEKRLKGQINGSAKVVQPPAEGKG
jgi:hypothetical protein